jgi:hypothetical protein
MTHKTAPGMNGMPLKQRMLREVGQMDRYFICAEWMEVIHPNTSLIATADNPNPLASHQGSVRYRQLKSNEIINIHPALYHMQQQAVRLNFTITFYDRLPTNVCQFIEEAYYRATASAAKEDDKTQAVAFVDETSGPRPVSTAENDVPENTETAQNEDDDTDEDGGTHHHEK